MTEFPDIEDRDELVQGLANCADLIERCRVDCALPMIAADLDFQRFWLASDVLKHHGLHIVTYFVIEKATGAPFGSGPTKGEAIRAFRAAYKRFGPYFDPLCLLVMEERQKRKAVLESQKAQQDQNVIDIRRTAVRAKKVSRRRRQVFEKSAGCCHYCATPLELEGAWHIEHMTPKALDGSNDMTNLVASCVPCNVEKRDSTAEEYIAKRAKKSGATA